MIKVNSEENVVVCIHAKEFCLKNKDEYMDFIIILTDPLKDFDESNLEVDSKIQDPRLHAICMKYNEFFKNYLNEKETIIKEARELVMQKMSENNN